MRFYLLLILFSQPFLFAQEEAQKLQPNGVFSIMPWNFQGRLDLAYAPWGNYGEANATIIPLTVFTGSSSEKCAYYTNGKLTLLRPKIAKQTETGLPVYEKVMDVELPMKAERISESVLLVTPPTIQKPSWSVFPLDFDRKTLPSGMFSFNSRFPQSLNVTFGESRFVLAPNSVKTVDGKIKEGGRAIGLSISQGSQILFSKKWLHSNSKRGMFFINASENGLKVTRFVDSPRPIEQALGYGLPPTPQTEEKKEIPKRF